MTIVLVAACGSGEIEKRSDSTAIADSVTGRSQTGQTQLDTTSTGAIDTVLAAIRRYKLTTMKRECIAVAQEEAPAGTVLAFTAREHHGGPCVGDTLTSPRLFSVEVDTATWALSTDARSRTMTMEPMRAAPH